MEGDIWELVKTGGIAGGSLAVFYAITLKFLAWAFPFKASRDDVKQAREDAKQERLDKGFAAYTKKVEERCNSLEERCDRQEQEIEACHEDKRQLAERVSKLEGYSTGIGDLNQNEQLLRALIDRVAKLEVGKR